METVPLFQQRRFVTMLLDLILSMVLFFGAKYIAPSAFEDIKTVILAIQPIFLSIVAAYTVDNAQLNKAGFARTKAGIVPLIGPPKK